MKFAYRRYLSQLAGGQAPLTVYRPAVPLILHGPKAVARRIALVDTGADFTLLPQALASELGVAVNRRRGIELTGIGNATIQAFLATVDFELRQEDETFRWNGLAYFADQDYLLLGNEGFLEQFRATFDWSQKTLELLPTHVADN